MMSWLDCTLTPNAFTALYSTPPTLEEIELTGVVLSTTHGPAVAMGILTTELPDRPTPRRWLAGFNRVNFALTIYGIRSLTVNSWSAINIASVDIVRLSDGFLQLTVKSANEQMINCIGEIAQVDRVQPLYHQSNIHDLPG